MNMLVLVIVLVASLVALLLILALFVKKEHYVKREIVIDAPVQQVFDFVKLLKNQELFNKHAAIDADRKKEFMGIDGTVGFIYAWSGNKNAGEGQKEIKQIIDGKLIETEMRFVKPMVAVAQVIMTTESINDNQTKVSWSNLSSLNYPLNVMVPLIEKMLAKDMDKSLLNLKSILEKNKT